MPVYRKFIFYIKVCFECLLVVSAFHSYGIQLLCIVCTSVYIEPTVSLRAKHVVRVIVAEPDMMLRNRAIIELGAVTHIVNGRAVTMTGVRYITHIAIVYRAIIIIIIVDGIII